MSLEQYLPVLLFILVGLVVGVAPQAIGYFLGPQSLTPPKIPPMNVALKPLMTLEANSMYVTIWWRFFSSFSI